MAGSGHSQGHQQHQRQATGALRAWVPVAPKPKGNAQKIVRNPRTGALKVVNDSEVRSRQRALVLALRAHQAAPTSPLRGAVLLSATMVLKVPKPGSWPKWKREAALAGLIHPLTEAQGSSGGIPDRGNLLKLLEDCLEKAGWVSNDSQFCDGPVAKRYGEVAGYEIELRQLSQVTSRAEWLALQREELGT